MKGIRVLIIGSEIESAQNLQNILENEGYEVALNLVITDAILQQIDTLKPQLVLIDYDIQGKISSIEIGKYILNADLIPFIYYSSEADNITLEKIKVTRPYGFLVKPVRRTELNALVKIILYNYSHKHLDLFKTDKKVIEDVPYRIRHVINYINENIYEKIDIDELAKLTKWKKHHFIRIFHSIIGNTPYQYILFHKMEIAKALIEETDQPINEIAFDLGFINYSNFGHVFKKICHTSPENYRKTKKAQSAIEQL
ncbi:DNA-binding response regulator [Flavobacterium sp.]|jgi:AraC-like DNA-binding protein|uniref:DNA-binding response regulator n=1 Tax=Flavobacterium sp. TaxID=239 RepID=UPI0037C14EAF